MKVRAIDVLPGDVLDFPGIGAQAMASVSRSGKTQLYIWPRFRGGALVLPERRWVDVRRAEGPRYRATWEETGEEVYSHQPSGNLVGDLPIGARPCPTGERGTLDRKDGGDPFERARFICPSGRVVVVEREP